MADCLEHSNVDGDKFIEQSEIKELESKLKENVISNNIERATSQQKKELENEERRANLDDAGHVKLEGQQQQQQANDANDDINKGFGSNQSPATALIKNNCDNCNRLQIDLDQAKAEKIELEKQLSALKKRIQTINGELEREVQRRCEMEQKFTEEAKRSTDQIEELIAKSNQDDVRLSELKRKFDLYSQETSVMIESFTTNRELLTSQLLQLRQENDYLLGKYIGKSRDLQNEEINLPQTVDDLQFHCLTLNEKLILATLAKEQLEETLMQNTTHNIN